MGERSCVLIAEDDAVTRKLIARALRDHGCDVVEAASGVDALDLARTQHPHLAIVDLRMPQLSGLEVVSALKTAHGAALPVLALSASAEQTQRVRAFEAGADDFIAKPVDLRELVKRVEAFERTRRAYAELQAANERNDRLRLFAAEAAALLAHDLNNGLTIAITNLQFIDDVKHQLDEESQESIDVATRTLRRMAGLVRNFVDISRLEDAALIPERTDVDVSELLRQAAYIHEQRSSADDQGIVVTAPDRLIASVDRVLLERVIHNLFGNAVRYVDDGGLICARASVEPIESGAELVIQIGNTGPAVPADIRAELFAKYRRGKDGKAQLGMGLYFCHLACEAHGGAIALEDDEQFPTNFVIRLPCEHS